jgi:very-short-patch-repair endonuclease
VLISAVGDKYHVFPQVHLPSIVDSRVIGQNWNGAFRHVSQKSVDFVLCDKEYISPKLVIELDDKTHERLDRIERDGEVEIILKEASLPLLRLQNHGSFNKEDLIQKIKNYEL